ncbi:hypothetical protein Ancab_027947 [Ancistrocladus abbreviatus]
MIGTDGSWLCQQHSTWEPPNLSCMIGPPEARQHQFLAAHINPCGVLANLGLNGYEFSTFPEKGPGIEANCLLGKYVPHIQTSVLTPNPFVNGKQDLLPAGLDGKPSSFEASSPQQKRYLIFDYSGNQTTLILGSPCPPIQNSTAAVSKSLCAYNSPAQGHLTNAEQISLDKPILQEDLEENHIGVEGSDFHEDTDEINALLYSDDDNESQNDDENYNEENDDEISTGHSPLAAKEKFEAQVEDITEEVASSDVSFKRGKALDGGYTKMPFTNYRKPIQPHVLHPSDTDADFSHSSGEKMGPLLGSKRPRRDKIRHTLKILQSIVPNTKGKEPVVVLDEAINYLKSLKFEVKAFLLEEPRKLESPSTVQLKCICCSQLLSMV